MSVCSGDTAELQNSSDLKILPLPLDLVEHKESFSYGSCTFPLALPAGVVFCMGSDVALGTDAADSSVSMPCARGHSGVGISPCLAGAGRCCP